MRKLLIFVGILLAVFGIVVVVSVSAYIVGSIMIDTQDWIGRTVTPERLRLPLTESGRDRLSSLLPPEVTQRAEFTDANHEQLEHVARSHLARKKNLLKIRILD